MLSAPEVVMAQASRCSDKEELWGCWGIRRLSGGSGAGAGFVDR